MKFQQGDYVQHNEEGWRGTVQFVFDHEGVQWCGVRKVGQPPTSGVGLPASKLERIGPRPGARGLWKGAKLSTIEEIRERASLDPLVDDIENDMEVEAAQAFYFQDVRWLLERVEGLERENERLRTLATFAFERWERGDPPTASSQELHRRVIHPTSE